MRTLPCCGCVSCKAAPPPASAVQNVEGGEVNHAASELFFSRRVSVCCQICRVLAPQSPAKILSVFSVLSIVFFVCVPIQRARFQSRGKSRMDPNPHWPRQHKVAGVQFDVYALRNSSDNAGVEVRVVFGIKSMIGPGRTLPQMMISAYRLTNPIST